MCAPGGRGLSFYDPLPRIKGLCAFAAKIGDRETSNAWQRIAPLDTGGIRISGRRDGIGEPSTRAVVGEHERGGDSPKAWASPLAAPGGTVRTTAQRTGGILAEWDRPATEGCNFCYTPTMVDVVLRKD